MCQITELYNQNFDVQSWEQGMEASVWGKSSIWTGKYAGVGGNFFPQNNSCTGLFSGKLRFAVARRVQFSSKHLWISKEAMVQAVSPCLWWHFMVGSIKLHVPG